MMTLAVHQLAAAKRAAKPRSKPEPVETFTPNPVAWLTALALADGDAKRLRAIDQDTILVANHATDRLIRDITKGLGNMRKSLLAVPAIAGLIAIGAATPAFADGGPSTPGQDVRAN